MAVQSITLVGAAKIFRVHPRTICRAISKEHNTYWYDDINEDLYAVADIAKSYGISHNQLSRIIEGRDVLMKPAEAAAALGIKPRTFRDRVSSADNPWTYGRVVCGGIVRYLQSKITECKLANDIKKSRTASE